MHPSKHNAAQTKQFFDRWHLYQQIIEQDYMAHQGIHLALRQFVMAEINSPFALLDLGCGDASSILHTFNDTGLQDYVGVDLSKIALQQAAQNLVSVPFKVDLIEADFSHYLVSAAKERFNLILAGFTLHHLYAEEKQAFFQCCRAALKPAGFLLLYDVFRRLDETREQYMKAYAQYCREQWTALSHESITDVIEHANHCDFPETGEMLASMAMDTGFTVTPLFVDDSQFHRLYSFQAHV